MTETPQQVAQKSREPGECREQKSRGYLELKAVLKTRYSKAESLGGWLWLGREVGTGPQSLKTLRLELPIVMITRRGHARERSRCHEALRAVLFSPRGKTQLPFSKSLFFFFSSSFSPGTKIKKSRVGSHKTIPVFCHFPYNYYSQWCHYYPSTVLKATCGEKRETCMGSGPILNWNHTS